MEYQLGSVPIQYREEATRALDIAWDLQLARRESMAMRRATGMEICPRCEQPGVVMIDAQGVKMEHPGRNYPCRIMWLPDETGMRVRVQQVIDQLGVTHEELVTSANPVKAEHMLDALAGKERYSALELALITEAAQHGGQTHVTMMTWLLTGHQAI